MSCGMNACGGPLISVVSKSGVPCVVGTLVGTIILAVLANGLTILQMPSFMQNIITGGIIILAVVVQKLGAGR